MTKLPRVDVAQVRSRSDPSKIYQVTQDPTTGALSCSCPGWIYSRRDPRSCRHTILCSAMLSDREIIPTGPITRLSPIPPTPGNAVPLTSSPLPAERPERPRLITIEDD